MTPGNAFASLLWFVAVLALIPLALWLFKRSGAAGMTTHGPVRTVATLPLAPGQRLVTVEVGLGDSRRWLVLGVTAQQITTLHEMAPQEGDDSVPAAHAAAPFAQLLHRLQPPRDKEDDRAR